MPFNIFKNSHTLRPVHKIYGQSMLSKPSCSTNPKTNPEVLRVAPPTIFIPVQIGLTICFTSHIHGQVEIHDNCDLNRYGFFLFCKFEPDCFKTDGVMDIFVEYENSCGVF